MIICPQKIEGMEGTEMNWMGGDAKLEVAWLLTCSMNDQLNHHTLAATMIKMDSPTL